MALRDERRRRQRPRVGIELKRVAQDGTRIRASAGTSSFRRKKSLDACLEEARRHVADVAERADESSTEIQAAARKRAALDRLDRFLVRTLPKVTCVAFWSAIAYNALKLIALV